MRIARAVQRMRAARSSARSIALALALAGPGGAYGSPTEYVTVGDPLEAELRALDVLGPPGPGRPLRLPRLGMRPLQRFELDSLPLPGEAPGPVHRISLVRLQRVLARERESAPGGVEGLTPRLFQRHYPDDSRFELSVAAEGGARLESDRVRYRSGTGLHGRIAVETDRWLAFAHLSAAYQDTARGFGDPIFLGTDIIAYTEESYLSYNAGSGRWAVQFGRGRWHWGPGEEGSLLLSKTAAPMTGLALHARLEPLHADGTALSATLAASGGEQLAAHRLEWQLRDGLRVGLAEAARYRSEAWQPLYVLGVIPYIIVQKTMDQEEPDQRDENRNNALVAADVAWRVAPGTRLYGEFLADDLHLGEGKGTPNKYAYQVGWDGVGVFRGTRVVWGGEYTRLTRFVYTSHFGRSFAAQGQPLGFPTGPDAKRMRVRTHWDLSAAWQITALATLQEQGENTLQEPFQPDSPRVEADTFQGVVEEIREVEAGVRWWPSGGVDLTAALSYRWVDNAGHVAGARERGLSGRMAFRLVR
jgi:hypothetical protein